MLSARDALGRLREGNSRFASGVRSLDTLMSQTRREEFVAGQKPFAVVVGCSDSRVPVEMIFDQGLGDLFVIRVAGNIVAPSQIGSVEFAAERFGTRLVVVLGHTLCGAIEATLEELQRPTENQSRNLRFDRRSHPTLGRGPAGDRAQERPGGPGARGGASQRPRVCKPAETWV